MQELHPLFGIDGKHDGVEVRRRELVGVALKPCEGIGAVGSARDTCMPPEEPRSLAPYREGRKRGRGGRREKEEKESV